MAATEQTMVGKRFLFVNLTAGFKNADRVYI